MGTQNPSVPPHAQARLAGNKHPNRAHRTTGGLQHDNTRHTTRFTVIGNHLAQHRELSLLAIGLGTHLQSLPKGAPADIKTLAARFPEGATRIAAALRELETHGYLRRECVRTSTGRIVTRTISCNQPAAARHPAEAPSRTTAGPQPQPQPQEACEERTPRETREQRAPRKPLP
ncbi:DNA-binding protein, partial [Streptomyces caelestis]